MSGNRPGIRRPRRHPVPDRPQDGGRRPAHGGHAGRAGSAKRLHGPGPARVHHVAARHRRRRSGHRAQRGGIRPRHASLHRRRNLLAWGRHAPPRRVTRSKLARANGRGSPERSGATAGTVRGHAGDRRGTRLLTPRLGRGRRRLAPLRGDQAQRVRRRSARRGAGRSAVPAHGGRHARSPTATTSPSCQRAWPSVQPFRMVAPRP